MTGHLTELFAHPEVAQWMAYAGAERIKRINDSGSIGKNNEAWEAGLRPDFYIEAQRVGSSVVLGGIASRDEAMIDRGLRAIEWCFTPRVLGPSMDWSATRDFNKILARAMHPRCMTLSHCVVVVQAILDDFDLSPGLRSRAADLIEVIEAVAKGFVASGDVDVFTANCSKTSQLSFLANALQGAAHLSQNLFLRLAGKVVMRRMFSMQLPDGAFGENTGAGPGYDTGYGWQTMQDVLRYRAAYGGTGPHASDWHAEVTAFLDVGANWLIARVQADGTVNTSGNSRTSPKGPPLNVGDEPAGWNLDNIAIRLAEYAVVRDRWDELLPVIMATKRIGQEYDHTEDAE